MEADLNSPTQAIADWVSGARYDDIPDRVIYEAKTQLLNIIAAIFAGYRTESGKIVLDTVAQWGAKPEATIIPTGMLTTVRNAVYANSSLSMTLDYDDYVYPVHTGHSAVTVPLAFVEKFALSGKDLLLAQIIATEVEARVGASVVMGVQNGQLCSAVHIIGAACAAGKLMGLSSEGIRNAIGIGMYQPNYGLFAGFMGSDAKILTAAVTASTGIEAAQLAAGGLTGTGTIMEAKTGFCENFSFGPVMGMFSGFGKTWLTDTICFKPYPGCAYVDTFVDCILKLMKTHQIDPAKISRVNIYANILTFKMDGYSKPFMKGPLSAQATLNFSVPFNAAVAILDKELTPHQFTRERVRDQKIWDLADKVRLYLNLPMSIKSLTMTPIGTTALIREVGALRLIRFFMEHLGRGTPWEALRSLFRKNAYFAIKGPAWKRTKVQGAFDLGRIDLAGYRMPLGSMVEIVMQDGIKFVESEELPRGAAGRSRQEKRKVVEEKFRREVGMTLGADKTQRALGMLFTIEKADAVGIRELIRLLCSER